MTIHMLIGHISRISKEEARRKSENLGVAQGFRNILFTLSRNDGITQLDLSKLAHLKPPTVSVSLQKMEAHGLVTRSSNKEDLRKTNVFLTEKGKEIVSQIVQVFHSHDRTITESLTEDESQQLKQLLLKVYSGLEAGREDNE